MVSVVWASRAVDDLKNLYEFIARDSKRYAVIQTQQIVAAADMLSKYPNIGHVMPEFPSQGYRQVLVSSYRIVYRIETRPKKLYVLAVLHQRQLPKKNLS